jgi:hypothetical protein
MAKLAEKRPANIFAILLRRKIKNCGFFLKVVKGNELKIYSLKEFTFFGL